MAEAPPRFAPEARTVLLCPPCPAPPGEDSALDPPTDITGVVALYEEVARALDVDLYASAGAELLALVDMTRPPFAPSPETLAFAGSLIGSRLVADWLGCGSLEPRWLDLRRVARGVHAPLEAVLRAVEEETVAVTQHMPEGRLPHPVTGAA